MEVLKKILEVKKTIQEQAVHGKFEKADSIKLKGLKIILGGGVAAWTEFMKEFATEGSPELARMIPTDGTHTRGDMNDARAYLVANSTCTPETVVKLELGVTAILDE